MTKHKPFSRTEMKILVYNKRKLRGMSYQEACDELKKEISLCIENSKTEEKEKREANKKSAKQKFDEEFEKIKDGKKR